MSSSSLSDSVQTYDSDEVHALEATGTHSTLSRVHTSLSQLHVVNSIKRTITNARLDDHETEQDLKQAKETDLGRILTHADFNDAMRVATHHMPLADELANAMPDDERLLRRLTKKGAIDEYEKEVVEEEKQLPPIDKGYAWVICFAQLAMTMSTWGSCTSFGVYISYWLNNDTFPGADPVNYALSSSITMFIAQALAPLAMISNNMIGLKPTILIGLVFHFAGFILCSFSTKLWQLYCTQGLMIGFGFSLIFSPAVVQLSSWFLKKRGLASGIVVCGAGVGGVIFTLASQKLIQQTGDFKWGMRMLGILTLVLNLLVLILIKERVPFPRVQSKESFKKQCHIILNIHAMKHWRVIEISLWFGCGVVSYIVLTYSLAAFATFIGLSQEEGSHITAIFNGCQAIGRPFIGIMGDKLGRINVAIFFNIFVMILIFAFFINCNSFLTLLFFSILSGLTTGWCQLLNQAIMPDAVAMAEFPSVWSYENIIVGCFCLFAEVVALKLRNMSAAMPFLHAQIFCGFMVFASLICIVPVREDKVNRLLQGRLETAQDDYKETSDPEYQEKIQRYDSYLGKGFLRYIKRLFYPIRV